MDITAMSLESDRPRCMGTDAQDGGLVDAALMSRQSLDPADMPGKLGSGAGAADVRTDSPKTLRAKGLGRSLGRLPALVLAGALCLAMASPALADFESAVAAYEDGAYREAQAEFEALAAAGEGRATPYLVKISRKLLDEKQTDGSLTTTISETVTSILGGPDRPSDDSESKSDTRDTGSFFTGLSIERASSDKPADWEPWSPFGEETEPTPLPVSNVAIPQRRSIWSISFHLPADATVVGLQYAAQVLDADNLSRELQIIGRHSDRIALSILAGFWWLVIIRGVVGIGVGLSRFMKAATTITGQRRYG